MEATHIQKNHKEKDQEGTLKILTKGNRIASLREDKEDEIYSYSCTSTLYIWV